MSHSVQVSLTYRIDVGHHINVFYLKWGSISHLVMLMFDLNEDALIQTAIVTKHIHLTT